jgi:hypothetical protein
MQHAKPVAYIFVRSEEEGNQLRRELTPIAKKYKQYISFGIIDANEYAHMAENLELKPNVFPAFVLHNILNDQVYPFDQSKKITMAAIDQFLSDITSGRVSGQNKSEGANVSDYEDDDEDDEMWEHDEL